MVDLIPNQRVTLFAFWNSIKHQPLIHVVLTMMLKLHILSLITVFLADGINAWDNDYIKFNMKKLESGVEYLAS